jgi:predicted transcriptional regulator
MTEQKTIKKTFSLPKYVADRLDEVSGNTGYSQSNLVLQAVAMYLHRYEQDDTLESWMEWAGRTSGNINH